MPRIVVALCVYRDGAGDVIGVLDKEDKIEMCTL